MSACYMCMGTDCAGACARGSCYAEYMAEQQALHEQAMQAEYDAYMDDASEAAVAIGLLAQHFAQGIEAATAGETGNTGSTEGESPIPKGCAQ